MTLSKREKDYLFYLYSDPKRVGSFSGIQALLRAIKKEGLFKISRKDLIEWLQQNQTYSLHKPLNRKFPREEVLVSGINIEWEMDLADMALLVKFNKGFNYFLVVIDDFSKFVYTAPLKTKTGKEVASVLKNILNSNKELPAIIRCDKGTEFSNALVTKLLADNNIKLVLTQNETKACIVERCIKTLKNRIYRYFTQSDKLNWIDILPDITNSYNNSYHRSIAMTPDEVRQENEDKIWSRLHKVKDWQKRKEFKFDINDKVRITNERRPFQREYDMKWTMEFFIVCDRFYKGQIAKYKLKDYMNEEITGSFYEDELQKIKVDDDYIYIIDEIIGRRVRRGRREVLVRWKGWPQKFNTYIPEREVGNYAQLIRGNR